MKSGRQILVVALVLGACMFACMRWWRHRQEAVGGQVCPPCERQTRLPELEWLRGWLQLTDTQFARVRSLHLDYQPQCRDLCRRIRDAESALLEEAKRSPDDLARALRVRAEVEMECQQALLTHIHRTAACLDPARAGMYLDTLLPHALRLEACPEVSPSSDFPPQ